MSMIHFIGAGPGDPELITIRALRLIRECSVLLYAGSLVPKEIVDYAPSHARIVDTAPLHLDEIISEMVQAFKKGQSVARVHSGDPSIYGAIAEQMRRLKKLNIPYDVTPGVPAFAAAAAAMNCELTLPEISQSIILSRTDGAASPMPEKETLYNLAATGGTLVLHLSIRNIRQIVRELSSLYGADCPIVIAYRVGWPDQMFLRGTFLDILEKIKESKLTRTALIMIGRVFGEADFPDSKLYYSQHRHILRPGKNISNHSSVSSIVETESPS